MVQKSDKSQNYNIIICHNDPLTSIGGTELYVKNKNEHYLSKNISSLTIYINKLKKDQRKSNGEKYSFGINLDKNNVYDNISIDDLKLYLENFINENSIKNIFYENFYNWINYKKSLDLIFNLTKNVNANKVFYVHDTLFRCPKTLFYVKDAYCGAGDKNFSIFNCLTCKNGGLKVITNKQIFLKFLKISDQIILPSEYIKELFLDYFKKNDFFKKTKVIEHLKKTNLKTLSSSKKIGEKIRIAFLGNNDKTKGFNEFIKLSQNQSLQKLYEFYVIGKKYNDNNIINIEASYNDKKHAGKTNSVISDILFKERINLTFLFSKMPESYSFTMHESDAANVPVLTSVNSGNIHYQVDKGNIYGKSFYTYEEVVQFLTQKKESTHFIKSNNTVYLKRIELNI